MGQDRTASPTDRPLARGRAAAREHRDVVDGILWVLKTGARWRDLPEGYPSGSTCWRRLRAWDEDGTWLEMWRAFLGDLDARGRIRWENMFIDGSFASAKKGALTSEKPSGEGFEVDGGGRRPGCSSGNTCRLGQPGGGHARRRDAEHDPRPAGRGGRPRQKPVRLIGDRAYDSDRLRERLAAAGLLLSCRTVDNSCVRQLRGPAPPAALSASLDHRAHVCVARELRRLVVRHERTHVDVLFVTLFRRSGPVRERTAGDVPARPGPLEVEAADPAVDVEDLADADTAPGSTRDSIVAGSISVSATPPAVASA